MAYKCSNVCSPQIIILFLLILISLHLYKIITQNIFTWQDIIFLFLKVIVTYIKVFFTVKRLVKTWCQGNKLFKPIEQFLSSFYRSKDDCWNTGCLNRNCFEEIQNGHTDFSWSEQSTIYGEKDLITDIIKGLITINSS